jgi:hypothetical protein
MHDRVRFPTYCLLITLTLAAASAGALTPAPASAAAGGPAGHWRAVYYVRCTNAAQYASLCAGAAQIKLPLADEKDASFETQRTLDIVSDSHGRFRFQSRVVTVERARGSLERCHSYSEDSGTLAGICEMRSYGQGHIAPGATGLPDFWMEQRTTVYRGSHTYQITRSEVLDTLTPATPGSWDTAHLVTLHGFGSAPPGFTFRLSVVHDLPTTGTITGQVDPPAAVAPSQR